jgi:hypothetical protein
MNLVINASGGGKENLIVLNLKSSKFRFLSEHQDSVFCVDILNKKMAISGDF